MRPVREECVCVGRPHPVMEMLLHLHVISPIINVYVELLELLHVQRVKRVWAELACAEETQLVMEILRRMVAMELVLAHVEVGQYVWLLPLHATI